MKPEAWPEINLFPIFKTPRKVARFIIDRFSAPQIPPTEGQE